MTLWLEFGFLSFMLFVFAVLRAAYVRGNFLQLVFLFVALFFGNGINTQVVWIYICLLHANQWFHTTEAKKLRRSKFQKIGISESQSIDRFAVHKSCWYPTILLGRFLHRCIGNNEIS